MNLRDTIIAPLAAAVYDIHCQTGSRPAIVVYVSDEIFDRLCIEYEVAPTTDAPLIAGGITVRPERSRGSTR